MKVIILAIQIHSDKTELKVNDLVYIESLGFYTNIVQINDRYGMTEPNVINPYKYFIEDPVSGVLLNFAREEVVKSNIAYFDYDKYNNYGIKSYVAQVPFNDPKFINDINHIKGRIALDYDLGKSQFNSIHTSEFIGLEFEGEFIAKTIQHHPDQDPISINQFKLKLYTEQPNLI